MTSPPLSLYVHFPWCERKCPYCDFNSHPQRGTLPQRDYATALLADLEAQLRSAGPRPVETVFFGGGTPSLMEPATVAGVLDTLRRAGRLSAAAEVTLEANPGSVERGRFAAFRDAGVNRLSIGVQSFDDTALRALGRIHDGRAAHRAVETALSAGFARVNLDLMYGIPGQSASGAVADVRTACELDPGHVSHYQLTIEPGTVFARYPPDLPDAETTWRMLAESSAVFARHGYSRYEVSALARAGHRCRHNLNYWLFGDYIGIGAGAHGKLTRESHVVRTEHPRSPAHFLHAVQAGHHVPVRRIPDAEMGFEFMLNALRLGTGFSASLFASRTGQPLDTIAAPLAAAAARGLLDFADGWIRPTARGGRFLNDLQALFLPARRRTQTGSAARA